MAALIPHLRHSNTRRECSIIDGRCFNSNEVEGEIFHACVTGTPGRIPFFIFFHFFSFVQFFILIRVGKSFPPAPVNPLILVR